MYSYKTNIAPASLVRQYKNTPAAAKRGEKDPIYLKSKSSALGLQFLWREKKKDEESVIFENFFFSTVFPQKNPNSVKNLCSYEGGFLIPETSSHSNSLFVISQMPSL